MPKKKNKPLAPAPHPSAAMAFLTLVLLLAFVGFVLQNSQSDIQGAAVAADRSIPIGEGYGVTCAKVVSSTMEVNDCCSTMCKPYAKTEAYGPCWTACYKRGLRDLSIII